MKLLHRILPDNNRERAVVSIVINAAIAGLLSFFSIRGIETYGWGLFLLVPLLVGLGTTILYGYSKGVTAKRAYLLSFAALALFALGLLLSALEGAYCILMAAPLGIILTILGVLAGLLILKRAPGKAPSGMLAFIGIIPLTMWMERAVDLDVKPVVTAIEIEADPMTVWQNVVEFPPIDAPSEGIFRMGIAYPTHAVIEGSGVGAVRYCHFSTGAFVEPITTWDEPHLLAFDVAEQPEPLRELSPWGHIHAPHLDGYFLSKRGQFKLTALPNGNTLLEGTTWYGHRIQPDFYWRWWSDHIIHKIHLRVLEHIKAQAETSK